MPAVGNGPLGGKPPVVEHRLACELHLDFPLQAHRHTHEQVVGVFVGRRPGMRRDEVLTTAGSQGEGVAHYRPAGRRLPRGEQDVRSRLVDSRRRHVDAEGPEPEGTGLAVEQRAEHAWSVEAGDTKPVDRPVGGDQRAGVAVRQECIVGDRGKRRGHRRALLRRRLRGCAFGGSSPRRGASALGGSSARRGARLGLARLGRAHDSTHGPCQPPNRATIPSASAGPQEPGA